MNHEEKSHADWTNLHILEQMNREEKKRKLSVSSLLTNSLPYIPTLVANVAFLNHFINKQ